MRHAKSSWDDPQQGDHARPLNARGRAEAPHVAARLVELGWTPEVVLSSDSVRTRETFERMRSELPEELCAEFSGTLYHADIEPLRTLLAQVDRRRHTVLALGHNPGWEQAVLWLCGKAVEMKTSTAVLLEREAEDWAAAVAAKRTWRLVDVVRAKEL